MPANNWYLVVSNKQYLLTTLSLASAEKRLAEVKLIDAQAHIITL